MLIHKHKMKMTVLMIVIMTLLLMPSATDVTYATQYAIDSNTPMVAGEIVVKFDKGTPLAEVEESAAEGGYTVLEYYDSSGLALFGLPAGADVAVAAGDLRAADALPGVNVASPNYIYSIDPVITEGVEEQLLAEGDRTKSVVVKSTGETMEVPLVINGSTNAINEYYYQWGYYAIEADTIWVDKAKMPGVAVLDTGVDARHPDLKGKVKSGWDYVNDDKDAHDDNGHGTHVAGVIAAGINNDSKSFNGGIPGVASGVQIVSYKIFNAQGGGTTFDASRAIYDATDNKAVSIMNMSFGWGYSDSNLHNAVAYAVAYDQIMVVAAGNDNQFLDCAGWDTFPACYVNSYPNNIIVVGATGNDTSGGGAIGWDSGNGFDERYCKATYSNYGGDVDILAPGTWIMSTVPTMGYNKDPFNFSGYDGSYSGTSMAAPHVAGAVARVWGTYPEMSPGAVKNKLLTSDTAVPSTNALCWPNAADIRPFLNVAGGMDRFAMYGNLYDAYSQVPITTATVESKGMVAGRLTSLGSKDKLKAKGSYPSNYWGIINVPEVANATVYVNAKGYTKGSQPYLSYGDFSNDGGMAWYMGMYSIPRISKNVAFVSTQWDVGNDWADMYVFYPFSPSDYDWLGTFHPFGSASDNDVQETDGDLAFYPYMQVMYRSWWGGNNYVGNSIQMKKNVWNSATTYFVLRDGLSTEVGNVSGLCAWIWENGANIGARCLDTASTNPNWVFAGLHPDGAYSFYNNVVYSDASLNALIPDAFGNGAFDTDPEGSGPVPPQP